MAIAGAFAAIARPEAEQRASFKVKLRTGRFVMLSVPLDLDGNEALELVGYVAQGLAGDLRKAKPQSRITIARGAIPKA